MVNKSKLTQRRFWKKWRDSGAVYNHDIWPAPRGVDYCLICGRMEEDMPLGGWTFVCRDCSSRSKS